MESDPPLKTLAAPALSPRLARFDRWWILVAIVVLLIYLMVTFQPDPYARILTFVQDGIWITLQVTIFSFFFTLIAGLIAALGRLSRNWLISGVATVYIEIVRGIPLLVQLIFWYFAFPSVIQSVGRSLNVPIFAHYLANPVGTAIFGLTFCYAAYMSEIYRAGIQSIAKGQMEAARSLGMTHGQAMRYVILPQAVRVILPPGGNEFISLLKDSSLVSVVAVADITRRGREFMAANFIPLETWVLIALLYLVATLLSARVVTWLEQQTRLER